MYVHLFLLFDLKLSLLLLVHKIVPKPLWRGPKHIAALAADAFDPRLIGNDSGWQAAQLKSAYLLEFHPPAWNCVRVVQSNRIRLAKLVKLNVFGARLPPIVRAKRAQQIVVGDG